MSGLDDTLNNAAGWSPNMRPPLSFDRKKQKEFQKRIDGIAGTRDDRPLIKLAWAPDELRWRPHPLPDDPPGYTFPIFFYGWDAEGKEVAAPRWVLLQRAEPQHYASTWEATRYSVHEGSVWDWRGPCPPERYTELRAHCFHDGECCPCRGSECHCGEDYDHCWGRYCDPNERLLDWVRWVVSESLKDSDVQADTNINDFTAPRAQSQLVSALETKEAKRKAEIDDFGKQLSEFWGRKPVSISGLRKTDSGLYLLN